MFPEKMPTDSSLQDDDILLTPDLQTDRTQPTLVIPNLVASEDAGVYRCKGRNVWGEVAAVFPVKVHGNYAFINFFIS